MKHLWVLFVLFPLAAFAQGGTGQNTGSPPWEDGGTGSVPQVLVCTTRAYAKPDTPMQCFQTGASYVSTLSEISAYFRLVQIVGGGSRIYYYFEKR